jgi:glycine/D-amino acid oxidase-like deaminating enzyme
MPAPTPFISDTTLPQRVNVAVIGGGIAGVSTALELADRGVSVALFEKGIIGGEQSSRNWGWCRQMGRDSREIPLILESLKLWRRMNERVEAETGFTQCGIVYLCETEEEVAARENWYNANAKPYGLETRLVSGAEADRLQPGSTRMWRGALYTPNDGRAEPQLAPSAIAEAARKRGAQVFTNCAVRGIEKSAGRISGIVTEKGAVACDNVVLAGGAWSRRFCTNAGIDLPQLSVINSVQRTEPIETRLQHSCSAGKFAIRKRLDGGYTIAHRHLSVADILPDSFPLFFDFLPALRIDWKGLRLRFGQRFLEELRLKRKWRLDETSPFEVVRVLDPKPIDGILDEAAASLKDYYPEFESLRIAERWAGCIDATPDAVPVISAVPNVPGFFMATGFSGHGFGLGPGAGKLMAELVTGAVPCVDPTPFRYTRYFDGTNPKPTTGL